MDADFREGELSTTGHLEIKVDGLVLATTSAIRRQLPSHGQLPEFDQGGGELPTGQFQPRPGWRALAVVTRPSRPM